MLAVGRQLIEVLPNYCPCSRYTLLLAGHDVRLSGGTVSGYLIYHPPRAVSRFDTLAVYHDSINGNQDPYLWNTRFLHTYCHITQMSPAVGHINFWVSGDTFPNFTHLYCDLVFVVAAKVYWPEANTIAADDPLVETVEAFVDHYRWATRQHRLKRRRRFTLKADPLRSFQPQDASQRLIDIVPYLQTLGLPIAALRQGLRAGFNSQPFHLGDQAENMYTWLDQHAARKLYGEALQTIRKENPQLASP